MSSKHCLSLEGGKRAFWVILEPNLGPFGAQNGPFRAGNGLKYKDLYELGRVHVRAGKSLDWATFLIDRNHLDSLSI